MEQNIYGFFGELCYDIVFHLSLLLAELGRRTLVLDLTRQRMVMGCIDTDEMEWEYHQVLFRDYLAVTEYYDCVLIAMDSVSFLPGLGYKKLYVILDGRRCSTEKMAEELIDYKEDIRFVLRSYVSGSIGWEFYRSVYFADSSVAGFDRIAFDERDLAAGRELEFGIRCGLGRYSGAYRMYLSKLLQEEFAVPDKDCRKAVRRLWRGGKYEHSILEQLQRKWMRHKQSGDYRDSQLYAVPAEYSCLGESLSCEQSGDDDNGLEV